MSKKMINLKGKRLLILAGANVHNKIVKAARELGVYTIVTDNVPGSSAKQYADASYDVDVFDIESLKKICKDNHVDGVIACYIDPCQRPYQRLCEEMEYYCYGNKSQFFQMTDKHAFKKLCKEYGVDVIPEYSENDLDKIVFPVFVKPVDSRGSRGQSVCYNAQQLEKAISIAKNESSNGEIIIEKYMKDAHEFQVTYFFVNGEAYLLRTCDSYCGSEEKQMGKVVACSISPSRYTQEYLESAHNRVVSMFKAIGIKNGPVFMQGFEDNGVFRFFDPGLRFPGVDYELIYKKVFNIDISSIMISLALTGNCGDIKIPEDSVKLCGKRAAIIFPTINAGIIGAIEGVEVISEMDEVVSFLLRHSVNEKIDWTYTVNQRSAEIDCVAKDTESLKQVIDIIQKRYKVYDTAGNNMTLELFDTKRII